MIRVTLKSEGTPIGRVRDFKDADNWVDEAGGALLVVGSDGNDIATFAPGTWESVEVVEVEEAEKT